MNKQISRSIFKYSIFDENISKFMKKEIVWNHLKLAHIIIFSDMRFLFLSLLSLIIGFAFLFTFTSLTDTIIKTKQDNTAKTYGKFLMVIPQVSQEREDELKTLFNRFTFRHFGVIGNAAYEDQEITMGTMEQDMGKVLGFQRIHGEWPQRSDEIVVEEYLLELFGIEEEELPKTVSLRSENGTVEYEITGVISNYSYLLSTSYDGYLQTKSYPSMICGKEKDSSVNRSLVILQKKLNYRTAERDINLLLSEIDEDHVCVNEKLYSHGYQDNKDMIYMGRAYLVLFHFLMLLEQIVLLRAFLLRNKKTFFLFEAMGMSPEENKKLLLYLAESLLCVSLITGAVIAGMTEMLYMSHIFQGYHRFYFKGLYEHVLIEWLFAEVVLLGAFYYFKNIDHGHIIHEINKGSLTKTLKKEKRYHFKKIDLYMVMIQAICIFFAMTSFYCMNSFQSEPENANFELYSKRSAVFYPLHGYRIAAYGDEYFSFDAFGAFEEYQDEVSISAKAETNQSTLLLKKEKIDSYFKQYCENDASLNQNGSGSVQPQTRRDQMLWEQVADEAGGYEPISPGEVKIIVMPQKEFRDFLREHKIQDTVFDEKNQTKACAVLLPDYQNIPEDPSIRVHGDLSLGGIWGNRKNAKFCIENFQVGAIFSSNSEECSDIQIIMSEKTAKKSRIILGYDTIRVVMKKDAAISTQKEIEQKISLLMASIQGGMLDSSGIRDQRNILIRNYSVVLCNTMLIFCIVAICIYIILSIYIDLRKHSYEYGILRSFGMSYRSLQHKLFVRYGNSIIVACIINIVLGRYAFGNGMLTKQQILISIAMTAGVTYLCRIWLYFWGKSRSISSMLGQ